MSVIRMPVDAAWARRTAALAAGPWTVEAVEAAFPRYGRTGAFTPDLARCERAGRGLPGWRCQPAVIAS